MNSWSLDQEKLTETYRLEILDEKLNEFQIAFLDEN